MKVYEMIVKLLEMEAGYELSVNVGGSIYEVADIDTDGMIEAHEDNC